MTQCTGRLKSVRTGVWLGKTSLLKGWIPQPGESSCLFHTALSGAELGSCLCCGLRAASKQHVLCVLGRTKSRMRHETERFYESPVFPLLWGWTRGSSGGSVWGGALRAALWRGSSDFPTPPLPSLPSDSLSLSFLFSLSEALLQVLNGSFPFHLRPHHAWLTFSWGISVSCPLSYFKAWPWPWDLFILINLISGGDLISFLSGPTVVDLFYIWQSSTSKVGSRVQATKGHVFPWACAVSLQQTSRSATQSSLTLLL